MAPRRWKVALSIIVLGFSASLWAGCRSAALFEHGTAYAAPAAAPPLTLKTTEGSDFKLEDLRGKVVLLYFGYTHCPDFCPAMMGNIAWTLDQLGERGDQVQTVFVTTDPERDTSPVLRHYLDGFRPGIIGLSGDLTSLKTALDGYGAQASTTHDIPEQQDPGVVVHTSRLFVIDSSGRLRANYPSDVDRRELLQDLSGLLDATPKSG